MAQRFASCQMGPRPHSFALDRRVPEVGRQADRQAGSGTHTSIRKGGCWMSGSARKRRACRAYVSTCAAIELACLLACHAMVLPARVCGGARNCALVRCGLAILHSTLHGCLVCCVSRLSSQLCLAHATLHVHHAADAVEMYDVCVCVNVCVCVRARARA
jgi:hypothetical protein